MSFPRPSRVFSRHAAAKAPRLRAIRELIAGLPADESQSAEAVREHLERFQPQLVFSLEDINA